jgi:hypothetical protein
VRPKQVDAAPLLCLFGTDPGRQWLSEIKAGSATIDDISKRETCSKRHVHMTISLAFLSPSLVKAAVDGQLPAESASLACSMRRSLGRVSIRYWDLPTDVRMLRIHAHNLSAAGSSPANSTTQFCEFPVSWHLSPETRDSAVSAARNRPVTPKMPRQSLASPNFFPARIGGAHRDWFDSLQRSVRVSRWAIRDHGSGPPR